MIKTVTPLSPEEIIIPPDPVISLIQCRNSNAQNINSPQWKDIFITGIKDLNIGNSFAVSGRGIKCLFDGYIDIYTSIRGESVVQRAAPEIRIIKNDIAFDPISSSGYIRGVSVHNRSSSSLRILSSCKRGDIIKVQSRKEIIAGVVNTIIGTSLFLIKKINS